MVVFREVEGTALIQAASGEGSIRGLILPNGSEERGVLGIGSIPVAITSVLSRFENVCIIIA